MYICIYIRVSQTYFQNRPLFRNKKKNRPPLISYSNFPLEGALIAKKVLLEN